MKILLLPIYHRDFLLFSLNLFCFYLFIVVNASYQNNKFQSIGIARSTKS